MRKTDSLVRITGLREGGGGVRLSFPHYACHACKADMAAGATIIKTQEMRAVGLLCDEKVIIVRKKILITTHFSATQKLHFFPPVLP